MSQKTANRIVASVILVMLTVVFFLTVEGLVSALFEVGPVAIAGLKYAGGIIFACIVYFLISHSVVLDIISGETHEYPGY